MRLYLKRRQDVPVAVTVRLLSAVGDQALRGDVLVEALHRLADSSRRGYFVCLRPRLKPSDRVLEVIIGLLENGETQWSHLTQLLPALSAILTYSHSDDTLGIALTILQVRTTSFIPW